MLSGIRIISLAAALSLVGAAGAANRNDLVVMLGYRAPGAAYNAEAGAGVLVHHDQTRAVIVTARHVIAGRSTARDETIYVEFFGARGRDFPATVLAEDEELDLAAIEVRGASISPQLFEDSRRVIVPDGAEVVAEHGAFAVGNPNRRPWTQNQTPEPIIAKTKTGARVDYRFESSVAEVGMSGGALFSEHEALLGMVQAIQGSDGGVRALGIETIARKLVEWGIPYSLTENPEVVRSAGRRVLADLGLDSGDGMRRAVQAAPLDFGVLHLFWIGGLEASEVERVFGGFVEGGRESFSSRIFDRLGTGDCIAPGGASSRLSAAQQNLVQAGLRQLAGRTSAFDCSSHARLWVAGLVDAGLDPNLIVENSYYPSESLLAIALRSKNAAAALALLDSGASPHPYQDISGVIYMQTRVLAPMFFVRRDFLGAEQDQLRDALAGGGLVVSESIRDSSHYDHLAAEALAGLPLTPTLAETSTDPICERAGERYGFDWCGYLRELPESITFRMGSQSCHYSGYCAATLTHTLFAGADRALLLAERPGNRGAAIPVVVEVSPKSAEWYAWERSTTGGCIPAEDGFKSSYCWRRYAASPASAGSTTPPETTRTSRDAGGRRGPTGLLETRRVEGIALTTPLSEALKMLAAAGYSTQTTEGSGDDRDRFTIRDYSRDANGEAHLLKVIGFNDEIRALSFQIIGQGATYPSFEAPAKNDAEFLFYDANDWEDSREVLAVETGEIGRSYLRLLSWPSRPRSLELNLFRRTEDESATERAFFDRWLNEWFGRVRTPADAQRPCIDRYAHLRDPKGTDCQTPAERASTYLGNVRTGRNIRQLASGLSYETLQQGGGPPASPDSSVVVYVLFRYLDGLRPDDRINNWRIPVRDVHLPEVKEALLTMREGDKLRVYVPPGVGSNDSPYLQITDISLTGVTD